jgi:hypothetical protein
VRQMNFRDHRGEASGTFDSGWNGRAIFGRDRYHDRQMAESQLSELQNARVLLEEARILSRSLAYHRRARLEAVLGEALDEVDHQIEEMQDDRA